MVRDVAGEEASDISVLVLREVVATPPACLCKILRLSSWAFCSNLDNVAIFVFPPFFVIFTKLPTKLFTCRILSRAAPLVGIKAKAIGAALALGVY